MDDCGGPIDALFSCAGIADGPRLPLVNFIGQRHLIERAVAILQSINVAVLEPDAVRERLALRARHG